MKFTIIIPIYNRENYIPQTIESALSQSYQNIEVICVDDCSTDNSFEILSEYAETDSRIKILKQPKNLGTHMARKTGVEHATGEYVLFLDCDDKLKENACEKVKELIKIKKCEVLEFGYENIQSRAKSLPLKSITIDNLFDSLVYYKNPRAGTIWNKTYKYQLLKQAFSNTSDFYSIIGEDFYQSVVIAYYTKSYSSVTDIFYEYNTESGISNRTKTAALTKRNLESIHNDIKAFSVFFTQHAPEHLKAISYLENYFLDHMYYNQILTCVKKSEWKESLELLPNYFSKDAIQPYIKKINRSNIIINFDFFLYSLNKKIRSIIPSQLKNIIKKIIRRP